MERIPKSSSAAKSTATDYRLFRLFRLFRLYIQTDMTR